MDRAAMMVRLVVLFLVLVTASCGRGSDHWHATNITGAMPKLELRMQRASDGATISERDYRGRIVALYFGYTHCPDICPATLTNLSDVLNRLGPRASEVRVLFVTVDPERDTLVSLKDYVRAFAPQIDGLRCHDDQIAALTRPHRVPFPFHKPATLHPSP